MNPLTRIVALALTALLSACIELPEVGPESPVDGGFTPDGGPPTDTTPPTITSATPSHGSTQVALSSQFLFSFSEPMDVSTVQVDIVPAVALSGLSWSNGNTLLTLQPVAPLAENTPYTLTVDGKDVAGNALSDRREFFFTTTGPAPDTTPPTILRATPSHSAIGVARNASITVVFSEPMDKPSAQAAFAITSPPGFNSGVFDWNDTGTEMTFNPGTDFSYNDTVIWRVTGDAKDFSSNTLGNTVTSSFRIIRTATVNIDYDPLTSGSISAPSYHHSCANLGGLVGDTWGNQTDRLFIGFKLAPLPEELTKITHARLKWWITSQAGNPFGKFGNLLLEQVNVGDAIECNFFQPTPEYDSGIQAAYETPALGPPIIVPSSVVTSHGNFDVTAYVAQDWANRQSRNKRSQYRLRFQFPSDNDGNNDYVMSDLEFTPKLAELEVTYELP